MGTNGRISDEGVWNNCSLAKNIENNNNLLPQPRCLPFSSTKANFVFVADYAFELKAYLMKPDPKAGLNELQRVYN